MDAFRRMTDQQKQGLVIGGVIGIAIIIVVVAILLSGGATEGSGIDFTASNLGSDGVTIEMGRTTDGGHFIGSPDAPVTIVAFEDFLCPHCQDYKPTVNEVMSKLVMTGKAKFEFRFFRTVSPTPYAFELAECAGELVNGGFWVAHDALFAAASSGQRSDAQLRASITNALDVSAADLIECTQSADQLNTDMLLGQQNNVTGTPSVRIRIGDSGLQLINNNPIPSYKEIEATVALYSTLGG